MKKVFLAIAVVAAFTACNNSGEADAAKDTTVVKMDTPVMEAPKMDTPVMKMDTPVVKMDTPAVKK